ncbi:WSC domain-containing protein [Lachnellula suecica]|uniref:WSC domain-containing protein n=1 Tax=Lachnellula suecica TaxID=602035 RepID=A0A8T9C4X6_9HELO|nr:WSC domain-containing protein [Lachnellula suecica]
MACAGSSSETCGGPNALSVTYNSSQAVKNAASNVIVASYRAYGCYSDDYPSTRVLSGSTFSASTLTVESCILFCNNTAYTIAGVEYGRECYCGNTLNTDGSTYGVASSGCTFTCAGNNSETCGGPNFLDIYATGPLTSGSTTSTPAHFTVANANGSCASDYTPAHNYVRTLSGAATTSSSMTQEACARFCAGYTYYGVEYSTECYCGNSINSGAVVATNCTDTCAGNSKESCGGSWAMNIFTT